MKIYAYGDVTCRGDTTQYRVSTTIKRLEEARVLLLAVRAEDATIADDHAYDDFYVRNTLYNEALVVGVFINDTKYDSNLVALKNHIGVSAMGEEELFGYCTCKEGAIVAYAKANANDDATDEGGEW